MLDPGESLIDWPHLPDDLVDALHRAPAQPCRANAEPAQRNLAALSLAAIHQAVADHAGNLSAAARQLGISRQTLYRKLKGERA